MTAKAALMAILADKSLPDSELFSSALHTCRQHKMGIAPLEKLLTEMGYSSTHPGSVEEAVRKLVDMAELRNPGDGKPDVLEEGEILETLDENNGSPASEQSEYNTTVHDTEYNVNNGYTHAPPKTAEPAEPRYDNLRTSYDTNVEHDTAAETLQTQLKQLSLSMHTILELFVEEKQAAADREKRMNLKITELQGQVRELTNALSDEREKSVEREQRLLKQLNDIKSRLSTKTSKHDDFAQPFGSSKTRQKQAGKTKPSTPEHDHDISMPSPDSFPAITRGKPKNNDSKEGTPGISSPRKNNLRENVSWSDRARQDSPSPLEETDTSISQTVLQRQLPVRNVVDSYAPTSLVEDSPEAVNAVTEFQPIEPECWSLISSKKPTPKKAVFYVGNLSAATTEEKIATFVSVRSKALGIGELRVFNCKIFRHDTADSDFVGARITVCQKDSHVFENRSFWPRPSYARPWNFDRTKSTTDSSITKDGQQ